MAAHLVIGGMVIGALALVGSSAMKGASNAMEEDRSGHVTPESLTPSVAPESTMPTLMQHSMFNNPGARIRVSGVVDNSETIDILKGASGASNVNDSRNIIDSNSVDDLLARRS